jgi:hypothetical protein
VNHSDLRKRLLTLLIFALQLATENTPGMFEELYDFGRDGVLRYKYKRLPEEALLRQLKALKGKSGKDDVRKLLVLDLLKSAIIHARLSTGRLSRFSDTGRKAASDDDLDPLLMTCVCLKTKVCDSNNSRCELGLRRRTGERKGAPNSLFVFSSLCAIRVHVHVRQVFRQSCEPDFHKPTGNYAVLLGYFCI